MDGRGDEDNGGISRMNVGPPAWVVFGSRGRAVAGIRADAALNWRSELVGHSRA